MGHNHKIVLDESLIRFGIYRHYPENLDEVPHAKYYTSQVMFDFVFGVEGNKKSPRVAFATRVAPGTPWTSLLIWAVDKDGHKLTRGKNRLDGTPPLYPYQGTIPDDLIARCGLAGKLRKCSPCPIHLVEPTDYCDHYHLEFKIWEVHEAGIDVPEPSRRGDKQNRIAEALAEQAAEKRAASRPNGPDTPIIPGIIMPPPGHAPTRQGLPHNDGRRKIGTAPMLTPGQNLMATVSNVLAEGGFKEPDAPFEVPLTTFPLLMMPCQVKELSRILSSLSGARDIETGEYVDGHSDSSIAIMTGATCNLVSLLRRALDHDIDAPVDMSDVLTEAMRRMAGPSPDLD